VTDVVGVRQWEGHRVAVSLRDGTSWVGRLRTDLLTDRSVSVFVCGDDGEGATLYLDQIVRIVPASQTP
jgi:hypothetical protein